MKEKLILRSQSASGSDQEKSIEQLDQQGISGQSIQTLLIVAAIPEDEVHSVSFCFTLFHSGLDNVTAHSESGKKLLRSGQMSFLCCLAMNCLRSSFGVSTCSCRFHLVAWCYLNYLCCNVWKSISNCHVWEGVWCFCCFYFCVACIRIDSLPFLPATCSCGQALWFCSLSVWWP